MARPSLPCALDSALIRHVTQGGRGVPASWASATSQVQCDLGARGWEICWAMLSQMSYPDTPMGLRVHQIRTAGVSSPCDPETPASTERHLTLPPRPPPALSENGLLVSRKPETSKSGPLAASLKESPAAPFLPSLITAHSHSSALGPPLYLRGHSGAHSPLRRGGCCGLEVCFEGEGCSSGLQLVSASLSRAHLTEGLPAAQGGWEPLRCWGP